MWVRRFESEKKVWGEREVRSVEREVRKVNFESCLSFKQKTQLDGSKILSRICRALNLNKRESVEVLSRICRWQKSPRWIEKFVKNLSSKQRAQEFFLMDQRSYRDSIEMKPRNFDGSRICRGSIEKRERRLDRKEFVEDLSRTYRGAVELKERRFFKVGKTNKDECNKQATQTKIQATY